MISCSPLTAASVLDVSSVLSAPRLKAEALSCLARNLAEAAEVRRVVRKRWQKAIKMTAV
jgi:hypothetical protein